ncbi:Uncharacterised protein [Mycobacteroides abscessus subsp. abscessus]|nr:Uncharacterised protein [Mycobacteroides abscessus subsp. abscessus]
MKFTSFGLKLNKKFVIEEMSCKNKKIVYCKKRRILTGKMNRLISVNQSWRKETILLTKNNSILKRWKAKWTRWYEHSNLSWNASQA